MNDKIKEAFVNVKKDISEIKIKMAELKGMIIGFKSLRRQLREPTTRSTTRSNLKPIEKRLLKEFDKKKLMRAIKGYIDEGYSTIHIRNEVMNRFNIGTTCFYKYLKLLRVVLREPTTRSDSKEED